MSGQREGVVLRHEGSQVVVDLGGEEVACVVRKSLRRAAGRRATAVAVGDRVTVEQSGEGCAVVGVGERRNALSRPDPGDPRREQVLVANVDQVLIVASVRDPDLAPGLIDRFLVAAESRDLAVGIALNKVDLDPEAGFAATQSTYEDLGYTVLRTSAIGGQGLQAVRDFLAHHTTTLLGHSGVGKSSLANALDPALALRTGEVHAATGKGVHTTSTVSLLRLPWGGYLVDTPGIREFGLWDLDPRDLGSCFREIAALLGTCRFNDCMHEHEPGCSVEAAAKSGAIAAWRYDSYLRILASMREDAPEAY